LLLYLAVRTAIVSARPPMAAVLPPTDEAGLLRPLSELAAHPQRRVSADMVAISRRGAVAAPLAFEPFFILAKAEEQASRLGSAIRLMEEARRRRPSHLLTRLQLAAYYQMANRLPEMLVEVDFALRRSDEARRFILPEVAKLAQTPRGRTALAAVLARDPEWREELLVVARRTAIAPADALALLDLVRVRRPSLDLGPERGLYLHRLLDSGDFARARQVWLETLPAQERASNALLFNGRFGAIRAEEPFAWTLHDTATGRGEIVAGGSGGSYMDVAYFGGSNALLAEQTLALAPGRYRFAVQARSEAGISSGEIFWTLTCLPQGPQLLRAPIADLQPRYRPVRAGFVVPTGCPGQRLRLMAEPGDIAAVVNLQLANLEVARED
jgi:hypothetical protein